MSTSRELAAQAWAETFELIDLQLSPLGLRAMDALGPVRGSLVVDIGCGAGQTLLQLAERVGSEGRVIGVDIAPRLLDIAKRRTGAFGQIDLIEADAQKLDLPAGRVDAFFSRFGVMGFSDPAVAFANFHRMLKSSGVLAFCCWRSLAENELDALPVAATGLRALVDEAPFSFAERGYLRDILEQAGFSEISIQAHDEAVSSGDLDVMVQVLLKVGSLGKIVRENPDLRPEAEARLRRALAARGDPSRIALTAAVWIVVARPAGFSS
jgi:SAM-dependent methyltransferase